MSNPTTGKPDSKGGVVDTKLVVYDLLGKEVATLVNKQQAPGNYKVVFNASNLPSGLYLYKLRAGKYSTVKKMMLLK